MYYATFKGIGESDIVEFKTAKERDDWVNFRDETSRILGITPNNCTFEREVLNDKNIIDEVTHDPSIQHYTDIYDKNQVWYIRSVQ